MAIQLNPQAKANARQRIDDGKVDTDSPWSLSADEENALLGDENWTEYGKWFLGLDEAEAVETRAHYRYPVGKDGTVYRSALIAIRQRAAQQDAAGIFEAAGELIDRIDDGDEDETENAKTGAVFERRRLEVATMPWALMPERIAAIVHPAAASRAPSARPVLARAAGASAGAIAVIPLTGVIAQHPDWFADTSLDAFSADLATALADPGVGAILVSIDSPGGSVYGVPELAALMLAAREQKPIVALANSLAASAAYWIGCSASAFYCTPSGEVGSIGVWQAHLDISGALAQAGIKTTLIAAGKYKTEGNPYQPLDEDAVAFMQSRVDDYYDAFVTAVAQARGVDVDAVKTGMGQGRVLGARAAKQAGMIDGVMSLPQVLQAMQKTLGAQPAAKQATHLAARHRLALLG